MPKSWVWKSDLNSVDEEKNIFFNSIKSIPKNWKKIVLSTDSFYPPELIPNIEKTNTLFKKTFLILIISNLLDKNLYIC